MLIFDKDNKIKTINRFIKKEFGIDCNCYLCIEKLAGFEEELRFCFVKEIKEGRKRIPTQLIDKSMNYLFFCNESGIEIKQNANIDEIKGFLVFFINDFQTRIKLLLKLNEIFPPDPYSIRYPSSEFQNWQNCMMSVWSDSIKGNKIAVAFSSKRLQEISKDSIVYKLTLGIDESTSKQGVVYKSLCLDLNCLETTLEFYK